MAKKAKKTDGSSFRRAMQNTRFAMRRLWRIDKFYVVTTILTAVIGETLSMFEHTFLVAYLVGCIERSRPFTEALAFLLPMTALIILNMAISGWLQSSLIPKKTEKINRALRLTLYEKAADVDISRYDDPAFYNDFIWAMQDAVDHIYGVLNTVSGLCTAAALTLFTGLYTTVTDPWLLLYAAGSVVFFSLTGSAMNRPFMSLWEEIRPYQRKRAYINRVFYLSDYAKDLRMGEMKQPLLDDFREANREIEGVYHRHRKFLSLVPGAQNAIGGKLWYALILIYLLYQVLVRNTIGFGEMLALYNATSMLLASLQNFSRTMPQFQQHSMYVEKMRHFLDTENELKDTSTIPPPRGGEIVLSHVNFTYPGTDHRVLSDISLTVPRGSKVALVGQNGAGKSTLVKLIMRLYDPTDGVITYGGRKLPEYSLKPYRARIAALFQDHQIVAGTVAENITMSPDPPDDARMREAIRGASLEERIAELPKGTQTPLTREFEEDGVEFSGGETQKVAIARVLYSDADILILDEPSAALDPLSEYRFNQTVSELSQEKTGIFISHRLSTTRLADRIVLLDEGRIVEEGTHDQLMAKGGAYAHMFLLQAESYR